MHTKRKKNRTHLNVLPEEMLQCARVTWFSKRSVLAEGQHGVVELAQKRIRLRMDDGVLSVAGEELTLRELSPDAALIDGRLIHTMTYLKPDDAQ